MVALGSAVQLAAEAGHSLIVFPELFLGGRGQDRVRRVRRTALALAITFCRSDEICA